MDEEGSIGNEIDRDRQETDDRQNPGLPPKESCRFQKSTINEGSIGKETDEFAENPKLPPLTVSKQDNRFQNNGNMLEDFMIGNTLPYELSDIVGHGFELSLTRIGSWFIQSKLVTATIEDKNELFLELKPHALVLMKHEFGNYIIQKFFQYGTALQGKELADIFSGSVLTLSFDVFGCRVIEKAIEVVDLDQKIKIVRELDNHVETCLYDMRANRVIEKCVQYVPEEYISPIVSVCMDQTVKLAMDRNGCFIIENILKYKNPLTQRGVINGIVSSLDIFTKHGFSNYVVQSVVEHGKPEDRSKIVEKLAGNIVEMSLHMYGSKVIEKCLIFGSHCDRKLILNEILGSTDDNEPLERKELADTLSGSLLTISLNLFGCRVIRRALEVVDIDQKIKIVRELDNHVNTCLYDYKGSQVIRKCVEFVPEEHTGVIVSVCIDQIVKLAQHNHGSFIIEAILKYCKNPMTQSRVIGRIVSSLGIFTKHRFANYLVQSVVEHGKPEDRSKIVEKLAGNIVEMSLHMYGSKVIEKCLIFGSHSDRKLIVNEILGSTDGNEPLLTMMKDQFGSYVVLKALKTCDDENRELILSRIKIHNLKKFWFKKHIVNLFKKLVVAEGTNSLADNN